MAVVCIESLWGAINNQGKFVINPEYQYLNSFGDGLAVAKKGDKYGYIDKSGRVVVDFIYDEAKDFADGVAAVAMDTVIDESELEY